MNRTIVIACLLTLFYLVAWQRVTYADQLETPSRFIDHVVDLSQSQLAFYWRDKDKQPYRSFQNLKSALLKQNKTLLFAMNGGIFQEDLTPLGLYIEGGVVKYRLSTRQHAFGNFYIQPNGVFYLTESGQGFIVPTAKFKHDASIIYATQSGPLLLVDGEVNPKLIPGSTNLRRRNGVGILADGRLLFVISKSFVNFYDFASYFKQRGCQSALYLDGSVSRVYFSDKNFNQDGDFGVIIAETKPLISD